ncbi:MAG: hypothetical protein BAJALOKI1v1_1720009 [Promethearchaeota archaeon]|nr:MAG: hypothetical protein BAJALOKI1v1_1720009 [Candidatus Lokiarchaeota archaeon]
MDRDGVPFNPEPSKAFKGTSKDKDTKTFSLINRRLIRRARKVLKRVNQVETSQSLGLLKTDISILAEKLSSLLKGKKN